MAVQSQYPASFNLADLNGVNGFTFNGIVNTDDRSGGSVALAGDVNGDGINDIIIGARYANNDAGQSYVVFGSRDVWASQLSLSILNGTNGFILNGIMSGDQSGSSVSSAGDINGDGISDIIIGAYLANNGVGQSYVVFGSRSAWVPLFSLNSLNGTNGFILNGIIAGGNSGRSVASAGDVNGDGIADIIISATAISQSYIVFGNHHAWNSTFSLTALNGTNGFILNGNNIGGLLVASAGDVNDDGIGDLIIGAPYVNNQAGQTYIVFGHRGPWNATINLASLDGTNGFMLQGINSGDLSGYSVSTAGDVNSDKIADLIIGAYNANNVAGQSYVVFGHRGTWNKTISLAALNGINGFVLNGISAGDYSGQSVASAGDINSDGVNDLIIGAPYATGETGQSYVVFGHGGTWNRTISLAALNGINGFVLNGINPTDHSGYLVSSAGDINNDGISDLIIGAPGASHSRAGQSYVVLGAGGNFSLVANQLNISNRGFVILNASYLTINPKSNITLYSVNQVNHGQFEFLSNPGLSITAFMQPQLSNNQVVFYHDGSNTAPYYATACSNRLLEITSQVAHINFIPRTIDVAAAFPTNYTFSALTGTNGFILNGINANDYSGYSVSSVGDINGDSITDLIINAPWANNYASQSYVVFGNRNVENAIENLEMLDGTNGFVLQGIAGLGQGSLATSAGDINGDGLADLIIGIPGASNEAGQSYVIFGSHGPWAQSVSLLSLTGTNGFVLQGAKPGDESGWSIASAGDVNGDGISDLIIGAPQPYINGAGQTYIVFGNRNAWNATISLAILNGNNGFVLKGVNAGDYSGSSVASAGDVNGDGLADIIIGAPGANTQAGQSYVVFGHRGTWGAVFSLAALNGTNGFMLNGLNAGDQSGSSVASASDVNGDGLADIIIGARGANTQAGQSYVVFGHRGTWGAVFSLAALNGTNGFMLDGLNVGDQSGSSVASAGDINSDGLTDLLIGAPKANNNAGQNYVVFGSHNSWSTQFSLSVLNGKNGFILNGINSGDRSGTSVSSAGDINDDGVIDLIIGAPRANNYAGQSYVVFGDYPFLQLPVNQLTISNGQSLTLTSAMLSSRSFAYSRDLVRFSISDLQHGQFELVSDGFCACNGGNNVTLFTQAQVDAGEVIFVHDGGSNAPSYSVAFATSVGLLPFSVPQPATINFVTYLSIENVNFTVNQYQQQINLSTSNVLAKNVLNNDPTQIIFTVNTLENGWIAKVNQPKAPINTFTQMDINQGQISFFSPCGVNSVDVLPGLSLIATGTNGLTTAPATGTVTYNPAPIITKNSITITEQQTLVLSTNNIAATDSGSSSVTASLDPVIQFSVSNLVGGYFKNTQKQSPTINFSQADILNGNIEFISTSTATPSYNLLATDPEGATSLSNSGTVVFKQPGQAGASSTNNATTVAASVAIGGVAAAMVGLFALNRHYNSRTHKYISQCTQDDGNLHKLVETTFEKLKLKGFLSRVSFDDVRHYTDAIKDVVKELNEMRCSLQHRGTDDGKEELLKEFPRQIKAAFPKAEKNSMSFFRPEKIKHDQIKKAARHIAQSIQYVMNQYDTQIEVIQPSNISRRNELELAEMKGAFVIDSNTDEPDDNERKPMPGSKYRK